MILEHYSPKEFTLDHGYSKRHNANLGIHHKPWGLWVSIQGHFSWPELCDRIGMRNSGEGLIRYQVTLSEDANMKVITTRAGLRAFHDEYAVPLFSKLPSDIFSSMFHIDWARVGEKYDGIIISPHFYVTHDDPEYSWYYSWDIASGCIWNTKVIERLDLA